MSIINSRIKEIISIATYQDPNAPKITDEDKQVMVSISHKNTIGYLQWFASLEEVKIERTTNNEPMGDARVPTYLGRNKLAQILKERYYIYNEVDLADLVDIDFRECTAMNLTVARKIARNKTKKWCINTGTISTMAKEFFDSQGIQYLENTSKSDIINYLRSR